MYDLIVIGSGPGGYAAALHGAALGMQVALVEKSVLGGTCLNRGCIPTKTLLCGAHFLLQSQKKFPLFGLQAEVQMAVEALHDRMITVVEELRDGMEYQLYQNGVAMFEGTAQISAADTVAVTNGHERTILHSRYILVASGAAPVPLPVAGADIAHVLTSDALLASQTLWTKQTFPRKLTILGGGAIGCEYADFFSALGTQVTLLEREAQILPGTDPDAAKVLSRVLRLRGVQLVTGAEVLEISQQQENALCRFRQETAVQCAASDMVLCAIGRRPDLSGLFDQTLQPQLTQGRLVVDADYQTSIAGIYAIGDVTGGMQLANRAEAEGYNAVDAMLGRPATKQIHLVPACLFTAPEIASVGMTVAQAKQAGCSVQIGKYAYDGNSRAYLEGETSGFVKLIFEKKSQKLLGGVLVCPQATAMISQLTVAIAGGMTAAQYLSVIQPHPSYAEATSDAVLAMQRAAAEG